MGKFTQNRTTNQLRTTAYIKYEVSVRPIFMGSMYDESIPDLARLGVEQMHKHNDSALVLSYDNLQQHKLDNVDSLPDTLDQLSPWVANIRESYDIKIFAMKFEVTRQIRKIREGIYKWMGSISSYAKVDTISSAEITCLGFFVSFHPDHNNRGGLHFYLSQFLKTKLGFEVEMPLFSRLVYIGKGYEEAESRATVIEVSKELAQTVIDKLFDCPLDGYNGVQFVPFVKVDDSYKATLRQIFTIQNELRDNLECANVLNLDLFSESTEYLTEDESLRNIIVTGPFKNLIYDIDVGTGSSTNILYRVDQEESLQHFLDHLPIFQKKFINPDTIPRFFNSDTAQTKLHAKTSSCKARQHLRKLCRATAKSKQQQSQPPRQSTAVVAYSQVA